MARPYKTGLDYFELDCYLDEKIRLIQAEFGLKGFAVIVLLFKEIYGGQGYYMSWDKERLLLLVSENGIAEGDTNLIWEISQACVRRGIFSAELFEKYHILTSRGIQKRYFRAVARRGKVEAKKEYLLINCTQKKVNVNNNSINADNNPVNVSKSTQRREEKRREENIKADAAPESSEMDLYEAEEDGGWMDPEDWGTDCISAEPCPVCGADGTEPVQAGNQTGRIREQRRGNVEKSRWICLNGSDQRYSRIYLFTDWHVKEEMSMFKNCVLKVSVDTKKWLKAAGIRAVKTMAQTAVAVIGTGAVISAVDWKMVVSSAVVAGVVSVLTSVAGIPEVEGE